MLLGKINSQSRHWAHRPNESLRHSVLLAERERACGGSANLRFETLRQSVSKFLVRSRTSKRTGSERAAKIHARGPACCCDPWRDRVRGASGDAHAAAGQPGWPTRAFSSTVRAELACVGLKS
jgi:hypothetical protein